MAAKLNEGINHNNKGDYANQQALGHIEIKR
jgi:hypothetical protein